MNFSYLVSYLHTVNRQKIFVLSSILFFGAAIRLCGVNFGLPYLYDFDEMIFVDRAYYMLGNQDLNPHWFGAPASITIYLLFFTYIGIFVLGMLFGVFKSPSDFKELYLADPTLFYLSGRLISVFFGTAAIALVYFIGRKLMNHRGGCIAALVIAVIPLKIEFSRLLRMDAPLVFFILLAFLFCLEILKTNSWRSYLIAGVSIGFGISCKYPAIFFAPMILIAHVIYSWRSKSFTPKRLIASALVSSLAFFVTAPFVFIDFRQTLQNVIFESRSEHLGATGNGILSNLAWYISNVIRQELGLLGFILAFAAICYTLYRRRPDWGLAALAMVIFIVIISSLSLRWERWILPVFPFLALFIAYAIVSIVDAIQVKSHLKKSLLIAITTVVLLAPLRISILEAKSAMGVDTRTQAAEWIHQKIPSDSRILVELSSPQLELESYQIFQINEDGHIYQIDKESQDAKKFIPEYKFIGNLKDIAELKKSKIDYVVTSGIEQRYRKELEQSHSSVKDVENIEKIISIYEQISSLGEQIYQVDSQLGVNSGPEIIIYALQ